VVHTVPGIIDLQGSGIASGLDGPSRKQHIPEVYGDLAEWSTGTLPACGLLHVSMYVLSTVAYCSTQTLLAVEVPCQTVLKVFSAMLHML
jgi:hypothetical protein